MSAKVLDIDIAKPLLRSQSPVSFQDFVRSLPPPDRRQFLYRLAECSDEVQELVFGLTDILCSAQTAPSERFRAITTMADALFPQAEDTDGLYGQNLVTSEAYAAERSAPLAREVETMNTQETTFATRLKSLLTAKNLSQRELAERVGCSQPAISLMLQRACRPQKKTILKLASALQVAPRELWPDLDMAEMLDAVASFQSDDYVMSEAEAQAMAPTAKKNRPKIAIKPLPPRS